MADDAHASTLVIIGVGGLGREVAWLARSAAPGSTVVRAVTERAYLPTGAKDLGVHLLEDLPPAGSFVVAIGDPHQRRDATTACLEHGLAPTTLIHPGVDTTGDNRIGAGSLLCAGVVITTGITLGEHVHLNLGTTVGHDSVLGDYVTTAPGVHISGHVRIEAGAYLGTGAVVTNGRAEEPLVIGAGAVVAAAACVIRPVEAGAMVAGVPATRRR